MSEQITVVISNYNYGKYVGAAIESCADQTQFCKIIVVDDASTDDSWKIIKSYVDDCLVTAVRLKQNSGGNARGKNVGICLSRTPYVQCLDADDMLLPESLEDRHDALCAEDADFSHGWSYRINTRANIRCLLKKRPELLETGYALNKRQKKLSKEAPERWTWAIEASTVLARRSLYDRFGLYDEEMRWKIDREMWWRWLSHGVTKSTVMKYVSVYRKHDEQVTRDRSRKNPEKCTQLLIDRKTSRKNIGPENTLLIPQYDYQQYIDEIEG